MNTKNHEKKSENDIFKSFLEICQIWAESFYMLTQKQDHKIFAIIMKNIEKALKSKSYVNSWLIVFKEYHDLIDVFKRQNADELFLHQKKYNIEIDLKSEKISNFEFLYSMLWNKFQVL